MGRESRRPLTAALATAALATGLLAGGGCGGSPKPLTRAQLLARADVICQRVSKKLSSVTIKAQKDLIHVLPQIAGYEQQSLADLSKLVPPASLANDWKAIVADAQTIADDTAKLAESAKAKDLKTEHALLAEIGKVQQHAASIAKRDGFKQCSQNA